MKDWTGCPISFETRNNFSPPTTLPPHFPPPLPPIYSCFNPLLQTVLLCDN
uniref:Uncharacterized protein n=1 Tax=Anguilla anguilla TaxID=7936 RepID=A0A0E9VQP8_ANGAN